VNETPYGHTEAGAVVLEIGVGTGALVVCAPAELAGREIEISPSHQPSQRRHACIRERRGGAAISYAAIYDRLPPARYTIWHNTLTPKATITVTGGQVTSYDWPADHRG
jgi:hypothetical protein